MSNQVISWSLFVVPWLSLVLMRREDIRRYLPAGLFAGLMTTAIHDVGLTYGFWEVLDSARPMDYMLPYFYGLIPVMSMWLLRYTGGRFWYYVTANTLLDLVFAYYFLAVALPGRGIYSLVAISSLQVWLLNLGHMLSVYLFQKLMEGRLTADVKAVLHGIPQPTAAKPIPPKTDEPT